MQDTVGDVLLWTPIHGHASVGRPVRIYQHQLCADTGCTLENLLGAMDDRDGWGGRRESGKSVQFARLDDDNDITDLLMLILVLCERGFN